MGSLLGKAILSTFYIQLNLPSYLSVQTDKKVLADLAGRPEHCLDLTFIHTLLSLGYEFPENQEMKVAKRVNGTELGWCLGATVVELLGGDVKCTKTS